MGTVPTKAMEKTRIRMIHTGLRNWPGGFPIGVVMHTPTVQELLSMAKRYGFTGRRLVRTSPTILPCMLGGTYWAPGDQTLQKYTNGDPYKYHRYCHDMDQKYTNDNGWLSNMARLLICWMAEELCARGRGNGASDHFKFARYTVHRRTPALSDTSSDSTTNWESALVEYYNTTMDDNVDTPKSPLSITSSVPNPPSHNAQRARTLGTNARLKEYLRNGASFKRKHGCVNYLTYHNVTLYKYVKQYMGTEEGLHLLEACDVNYDSFSIDHVWPQAHGGPDHLFNYHIMPIKINSSFGDTLHTNPDKQAYVGVEQMEVLNRLIMEAKVNLRWNEIGY
tara:strand:- start:191 stop:1198 length:1008 start_codon:yes stop_codon:yes gene_type:complete